jgi:TatD DNase family protein
MRLFDSHTHLSMQPLGGSAADVVKRARSAGVERMVVPAYDTGSWNRVLALAEMFGVYGALGVHPWVADGGVDIRRLSKLLESDSVVAVGEIGLDSKVDVPMEVQEEVLSDQLRLARDAGLPVILHCRGEYERLLKMLKECGDGLRGVFHAFSRGPQLAERLLELGLCLGIGGAVTRPRAKRIRRALPGVPPDRLLLETDSPSMGLEGVPAGESEPAHVRDVCIAAAGILGTDADRLAETAFDNADELFGLR